MANKKGSTQKGKLVVPGSKNTLDKMKYEIASELGVTLGPDSTSRANGQVGGEITKRLVAKGMNKKPGPKNNNGSY